MGRKKESEIWNKKGGNLSYDMLTRFNVSINPIDELAFAQIVKADRKNKTDVLRELTLKLLGISQKEFEDKVREMIYSSLDSKNREFSKMQQLQIKEFILENISSLSSDDWDKKAESQRLQKEIKEMKKGEDAKGN